MEPQTARKKPDPGRKRVFLVDDHPIVRQGLGRMISGESDLVVVGEAGDAAAGQVGILAESVDLAIIDLTIGRDSGMELIRKLLARRPELPILVLSMHEDALWAERVLRAGARGFIMKQEPPERILAAIREVLQGRVYVSPELASRLLLKGVGRVPACGTGSGEPDLSDREREVLLLIGQGRKTAEIADALSLSPKTVETYQAKLKRKLGLRSAAELARYAFAAAENGPPGRVG